MKWRSNLQALACSFASFAISISGTAAPPEKMETKVFAVAEDFMRHAVSLAEEPPSENVDPFAVPPPPKPKPRAARPTSRDVLKDFDMRFEEGAGSFFDAPTRSLTIRNTPDELRRLEKLAQHFSEDRHHTMQMRLHVLELPSEHLKSLEAAHKRNPDFDAELKKLLADSGEQNTSIKVIAEVVLAPSSRNSFVYENATEHSVCESIHFDMRNRMAVPFNHRLAGLVAELSATLGPDHSTMEVDCHLLLHPLPPAQRVITVTETASKAEASFPVADMVSKELSVSTTLSRGMTKLIGTWQPSPEQGRPWAVFLHADAIPVSLEGIPKAPRLQNLDDRMLHVRRDAHLFIRYQDDFCLHSPKVPLRELLLQEGIPLTNEEKVTVKEDMLEIAASPETIERIDHLLWGLHKNYPKTSRMLLQLVEAPWPLLQTVSRECSGVFDHAASWMKLEKAMNDGSAHLTDFQWIEGKHLSGAKIRTGRDHGFIDGLNLSTDGRPSLILKRRHAGTSFGLMTKEDGAQTEVFLDFMTAPEKQRRAQFHDPGARQSFELPMTDFHISRTKADFYMSTNHTRLLGIWQPEGREDLLKAGRGIAAFVHQDIVSPSAISKPVREFPAKPANGTKPGAWDTRSFRVPPDFLASGGRADSDRVTEADLLQAAGIPFPEGATARLNGTILTVKNTNENLDLIQDFVDEISKSSPKTIVFVTHLVELPPAKAHTLLKECRVEEDHAKSLQKVLDWSRDGAAKILANLRVDAKGGSKAGAKEVKERIHVTQLGISDQGLSQITTERRNTGTVFDVEPTVGSDGETVEMNLTFHHELEPPQEHAEQITDAGTGKPIRVPLTDFHHAELSTGLTMLDGSCRVIGAWKTHSDATQALFISCDVVPMIPK